jgi:hypothetical protein
MYTCDVSLLLSLRSRDKNIHVTNFRTSETKIDHGDIENIPHETQHVVQQWLRNK